MKARGLAIGVAACCTVAVHEAPLPASAAPPRSETTSGHVSGVAAAQADAARQDTARAADETLANARAALAARGSRAATAEAVSSLSELGEDFLPAIERRAATLARLGAAGPDGAAAMARFTDAARARAGATPRRDTAESGTERSSADAAERVDALDGIADALAASRTQADLVTAERLCLLRTLERMGTPHALVIAYRIFSVDMPTFRGEARGLVTRAGRPMTAALVLASAHPSREIQRLAVSALEALGITDPTSAFADQTSESIAEILLAYASAGNMGAMSAVVAAIGDPRAIVREAAREATRRYGENATWQLRLALENRLSTVPRPGAGHRELLRELCAGLDARREAPMREAIDRAVSAAPSDLALAQRRADAVLIANPEAPMRERLAPIYVALADEARERSAHAEASALFGRAAVLAPADPEARAWREAVISEAQAALVLRGAPVDDREAEVAAAPHAMSLRSVLARVFGVFGVLLLAGPAAWKRLRRLPLSEAASLVGAYARTAVEAIAHGITPTRSAPAHEPPATSVRAMPELAETRFADRVERAHEATRTLAERVRLACREATRALAERVRLACHELLLRVQRLAPPRSLAARLRSPVPMPSDVDLVRAGQESGARAIEPRAADARGRTELAALVRALSDAESERANRATTAESSVSRATTAHSSPESPAKAAESERAIQSTPIDPRQPPSAPKRHARPTRRATLPVELVVGAAKPGTTAQKAILPAELVLGAARTSAPPKTARKLASKP